MLVLLVMLPVSYRGKISKCVLRHFRTSRENVDIQPSHRSISTLGMSIKCFLVNVTIVSRSPVARPILPWLTRSRQLHQPLQRNSRSGPQRYIKEPYARSLLSSWLPFILFAFFVLRMIPASDLAASSVASRISHMRLLLPSWQYFGPNIEAF